MYTVKIARGTGGWLAVLVVILVSLILRPGATSVGPLLEEILVDLGQGAAWGGLLTATPGVCFAFFGALSVGVASRIGMNHSLWVASALVAVGLLTRPLVADATTFLLLTVLAYAGMAMGNVLVPAFVKRRFPTRVATMMALYGTLLAVGATGASALAVPLATTLSTGWRGSLATWGILGLLAFVPTLWLAVRDGPDRIVGRIHDRGPGMLRSRRAVALSIFFGVQSMHAYTQFGWTAQMYRDGGLSAHLSGLLVSVVAGFGILTGIAMPAVVAKVPDLRGIVLAIGVLLTAGYLGIMFLPTTLPLLWAVFLGLSGAAFPMALALITSRTRDPQITARLSGFAQSIGYAMAAVGPFLVGVVHAATGGWAVPLWALIAMATVMVVAGFFACSPGYVDDDLAEAAR